MDLSWSQHLKADAPTIVKNLRNKVKKHMEFISSNMRKFDNVNFALSEGQTMLGGILCINCRDAVKSKRLELHSKNETSHKKKNLKKLSPERQQIVNEITNIFIQLERSQKEDEGDEEYCTEEEYYRQEMVEMESRYTNKLFDKQDEMREMENKYKKEVKDKEDELRKVTIERDAYKKRNDSMSIKLESFDKTESELRELKKEHKRLKEDLDKKEYNIRKLKRELEVKEDDNERYRSSFQRYRTGSSAGADSSDRETQKSRRRNENVKLEHTELLKQVGELQDKNFSLQEKLEKNQGDFDTVQKEKEEFVAQLSQLQTERQTLEDQTSSLTSTNEELSSTVEALQRNIDRLTVELGEKQGDFDKGQKEKEEYVREVSQLQTERHTLEDRISSLNRTNEQLSSALKVQQQNIEKMSGELEEKQGDLGKGQEENEGYVGEKKLQTEKHTLQDQTGSLNKTNKEKTPAMEVLQRDIDRLTGELEETQGELNKMQKENEENVKDKSQLQTERKSILDKTRSLKGTIDEMSSTTESLQRGIDRLIGELVKRDEKSLLEESRLFKRKVLVMRLLRTSQSGMGKTMVDMVTKELKRQLGRRPDSRSFDFSIVLHETSADVSKGPLFVVCLSSKVGKNIPDALEGPKGGRDVYMIVLHHTTKESLSTRTSNSLRATGSELRQLGGSIDVVFSSDIALCECDFNITAVDKIANVLKKF